MIDFEKLRADAERSEAEKAKAFADGLKSITNAKSKENEQLSNLLKATGESLDAQAKEDMNAKIAEETAKAEKAIREKYERDHPAEWNESPLNSALKSMADTLFK